jgi:hypothetical protein
VTTSSPDISAGYPVQDECANWYTFYQPMYAESTSVTPPASGSYTFTMTSATFDGSNAPKYTSLTLFEGSYSAGNCVATAMGRGESLVALTASLTGGTTYLLVGWGSQDGYGGVETTGNFTVAIPFDEASPGGDPAPIPSWVQAYGRASADATCENGWDASWQSWAEPVTGGWVCTRSIPSLG